MAQPEGLGQCEEHKSEDLRLGGLFIRFVILARFQDLSVKKEFRLHFYYFANSRKKEICESENSQTRHVSEEADIVNSCHGKMDRHYDIVYF